MEMMTTRFGRVEVEPDDVILFPQGLIGLEDCRRWVLLADAGSEAVAWLQSVDRPETALSVISPRRFVPDYRFHVSRGELDPLEIKSTDSTYVLAIVSRNDGRLTVNLKAPLVINLDSSLGRQVVARDDQPIQLALAGDPLSSRKAA